MQALRSANLFTLVLGLFLLVEGIWGLFSNVVFGILTTNTLHASIHIVLAIVALFIYRSARARTYALAVGILLLVVGILRFVPGADRIVVDLLNVNVPVAVLNLTVGIAGLGIGTAQPNGSLQNVVPEMYYSSVVRKGVGTRV